jgi:2,3-bisphosphoglycerate-dependent phosphoglycerate mutase
LIKDLESLSEDQILQVNIPTGLPLVYQLDANLKPINKFYLGNEEEVKKAMEAVANQGKPKK